MFDGCGRNFPFTTGMEFQNGVKSSFVLCQSREVYLSTAHNYVHHLEQ